MTNLFAAASLVALFAAPAYAGGHSNKAEANSMAGALSSGINQDQATKTYVDGLGIGSAKPNANAAVPAFVSGNGNGGWGNIGSTLTGEAGVSVSRR